MWCILAGDTDGGGLDMVRPFAGLIIGMAFRVLVAAGWCNFRLDCWCWKVGGTKDGEEELRVKWEAICCGCCVGDELGDPLDSDERSDEALLIDTSCIGRATLSASLKLIRPFNVTAPTFDPMQDPTKVARGYAVETMVN